MNCLLVPAIGLDLNLINRFADSIDFPIAHKCIVNNGRLGVFDDFHKQRPDWGIYETGHNIGVAASWNLAPQFWPNEKCWLICNEDVWFEKGSLEAICKGSDRLADNCDMVHTNETYPCFVWTRRGIRRFGTFDENFFPLYYEDWDMRFRHRLGNADLPIVVQSGVHHGKPYHGGQNWNGMKDGCGVFNREYFLRKWGDLDAPKFKTPYNQGGNLGHWSFEEARRRKIEPIWETFMSMPNPSIRQ
jgi:GT2 family glycosyltransferase